MYHPPFLTASSRFLTALTRRPLPLLLAGLVGLVAVGSLRAGTQPVAAMREAEAPALPDAELPFPTNPALPVPETSTRYDFVEAAKSQAGGLTLTWRTVYERGVLGFDLYRRAANGRWKQVNAEVIPASNTIRGSVYRFVDADAAPAEVAIYKWVEWDEACVPHEFGPLTLPVQSGPTDLAALAPPTAQRGPKAVLTEYVPPLTGTNGQRYVKLTTSQAGLHVVASSTLAGLLGLPDATMRQWLLAGTVGLFSQGQAVGFVPAADGSALYFYATAFANNYGSQNVFWLTGLTNPVPTTASGGSPAPVANVFDLAVFAQETNSLAAPTVTLNPEEDYWFWKRILSTTGLNTFSLGIPLSLVVTNEGNPSLRITFFGGSSTNHGISVSMNGNLVGSNAWSGLQTMVMDAPLAPDWLKSGTNILLLNVANLRNSQVYFNKFELRYPRLYRAATGRLEFTANSNAVVTVDGFTSPNLTVMDVSNPLRPGVVSDLTVTAAGTNYTLSLAPATATSRYTAFQSSTNLPQPTATAVVLAGLTSPTNSAEFVLIAPSFLASTAEALATYRRSQGISAKVVTTESIYDELGFGLPSPYSVREFLARAYTNWTVRPRYAALIGDGSYDYRNLLGNNDMQVPTLMLPTPQGLYGSDTLLGDFTGDNVPEVAIGRLPVRTTTQLTTVINKIKAYEARGIRANPLALLAADFNDSAGNFVQDIQFVSLALSNKYAQIIVYPTSTTAALRAGVISNLNLGAELFVYLGHGALDRLGQAGYLLSTDVPSLTNSARLPLLSVMTCVAGEYSQPGNNCIAEELVLAANGGAIAVIAPTGLSANQDATLLNQRLLRVLRTEDWGRLGDFWRQAAAEYTYYDQRPMGVSIYNLIGDPTLRFAVSQPAAPPRRK